jgi:hypothetical protein
MAGVAYDPDEQAPVFNEFLSRVQPDPKMRDYLQRLAGYAATGHAKEQKLFSFVGGGANGKGTLMGVVMSAVGDYAVKAPAIRQHRIRRSWLSCIRCLRSTGLRFVATSQCAGDVLTGITEQRGAAHTRLDIFKS